MVFRVIIIFSFLWFTHVNAMKLETVEDCEERASEQQLCFCQQGLGACPLTVKKAQIWYNRLLQSNCSNLEFISSAAWRIYAINIKKKQYLKKRVELVRTIVDSKNNPQWSNDKELLEQEFFPL